nr:biotin--protein ligase isoform X1 [Aedes albopictus]
MIRSLVKGAKSLVTTSNLRNELLRIQGGCRIGFGTMTNQRTKPPNILVYAREDCVRAGMVETLRGLVQVDSYTVYAVTERQIEARAWIDSTALVMVHGEVGGTVANAVLDYFLGGGKVLAVCSDLLRRVLPNRVKDGEKRKENVLLSYDRWQNVRVDQDILEWVGVEDECSDITRNSTDVEQELRIKILVRENMFKSPSILNVKSWETRGNSIFTQMYLNKDNEPERDILKHLLDKNLDISIRQPTHLEQNHYKNAFLIGTKPCKSNYLKDAEKVLKLKNLELQFCTDSDNLPSSSETNLAVLVDRNPEDFSVEEYFTNLRTSFIGRLAIYCPLVTSSMDIVSNATFRHGFVVISRCQSRGSGRNNNQWLSPEGCAMFSLQLHVPLASALGQRLPVIQHLVAVAVVKAIRSISGYETLNIGVKWPNDIYANGCTKIGGLIINSQLCGAEAIVNVGCGVNLSNSKPTMCINDLIEEYNRLEHTNLPPLGYEETLAQIFNEIENLFLTVQEKHDLQDLYNLYYKYWLHGDKPVIVKDEDGAEVAGTISGIDEYGYLLVQKLNEARSICVHPDGNSFDMMKGLIIPKYF